MPSTTSATPLLIPTARIPLCCPSCGTLATVLFDGRRLSDATPHRLSTDTVWLPNPLPLPDAPPSPAGYPHKTRHEAMAHFGRCQACKTPLLTLSLSIASHATPIIRGHFVHDDIHLGIGRSRTLSNPPTLFTVHNPAAHIPTAAPQSWTMLRERYTPLPATAPASSTSGHHTPHPSTTHPLTVDQHIFHPVAITDTDLATLRGPGGLAIQHRSLPFWLPHLATLHSVAPLVTPLATTASAAHLDAASSTAAPLAA